MTVKAELVDWLSELSVIFSAMDIVARGARDTMFVHDALYKIIALHPILVCGSVRKVSKGRLAQGDIFELPIVLKE